jgi:hypothetical protein
MSLSHNPHPAIEVLLQTNVKPQFDRAMTARSKTFPGCFYQRLSVLNCSACRRSRGSGLNILHFVTHCRRLSADYPHPGVRLLLQTKAQVIFDSLMTALSKPLFPAAFAVDLAEC